MSGEKFFEAVADLATARGSSDHDKLAATNRVEIASDRSIIAEIDLSQCEDSLIAATDRERFRETSNRDNGLSELFLDE